MILPIVLPPVSLVKLVRGYTPPRGRVRDDLSQWLSDSGWQHQDWRYTHPLLPGGEYDICTALIHTAVGLSGQLLRERGYGCNVRFERNFYISGPYVQPPGTKKSILLTTALRREGLA
jgi:hypothetical protein